MRLADENIAAENSVARTLRDVARRRRGSAEAVAAAWMLAQRGVTAVTVGAASARQLDRWVQGMVLELPHAELERITQAGTKGASRE